MANGLLSWVSYQVFAGIIFLKKKVIGCYQPESSEVN